MKFKYSMPFIPYMRQTQKSRFVNPRHKAYNDSRDAMRFHFKLAMVKGGMSPIPPKTPFRVWILIMRPNHYTYDLDNGIKAVLDALQTVAFPDDRYCVDIQAEKHRGEALIEVTIEEVEDE